MRSFPLIDLGSTHTALLNGCLLHATHRSGLRPIRGNKFQRCTVPTQAHPAPLSLQHSVSGWNDHEKEEGRGKKKGSIPSPEVMQEEIHEVILLGQNTITWTWAISQSCH